MVVDKSEVERRVEHFKDVIKQAGLKLTHQRLEIFRVVAASLEHPSAEAVLKALQPRLPTVSLDTVYRTLWMLNDMGLVSTLGPKRESVRFDANLKQHHHFVCLRCGLASDFESEELNALSIPESVQALGSVVGTRVEVRGICIHCAKQQDDRRTIAHRPRGKERSKA